MPVILLTADTWDPKMVNLRSDRSSHEEAKMRIIRSLTSGMNMHTISAVRQEQSVSIQGKIWIGRAAADEYIINFP